MRVCFSQPSFIPWGGFFCRLMLSDVMVLLDDTLFAQGFTFVNRNRLKGHDGEIWITVPVKKIPGKRQKIRSLKIHEPEYWGMKWMKTLYHAYKKSQYFDEINSEITKIVGDNGNQFLDMMVQFIEFLKSELDIATPLRLQSNIGIKSSGIQLIMDIAEYLAADEVILPYFSKGIIPWKQLEKNGIQVRFLYFFSPVYPQFWGHFLKNLSILDLLFCMGKESRRVLENGFKIISF